MKTNLREIVFWIVDGLRGGKIRKPYKDIKRIMSLPKEQLIIEQQHYLDKLIRHAKSTTSYYRMSLSGKEKIEDFPVINKNIIKDNYQEMQSRAYKGKKLHYMTTSGSTGTPFTMMQDMGKRYRVLAELIYFNKFVGNNVGDKFIYFRVWTEKNKNSKLAQIAKNMIPVDILHFTDDTFEGIRQLLKKNSKISAAIGYVSTYEYLVRYLEKCGDSKDMFNIKTLITGSEIQTPEIRNRLRDMFGCTVVSRYSNEENGVLAHQCIEHEEFHVNSANYIIEILKMDSDEQADVGELGRVVVTDLFNYAFPIIRYDTGDLAIRCEKSLCGIGTDIITNIQGRKVDVIYDTKGNALTPHTWSVYMWKYDKLSQYQFIQDDAKDYLLKLNCDKELYDPEEIRNYMKNILGDDANIQIEFVNEIPHLNSGKFKKTICNYKRNV